MRSYSFLSLCTICSTCTCCSSSMLANHVDFIAAVRKQGLISKTYQHCSSRHLDNPQTKNAMASQKTTSTSIAPTIPSVFASGGSYRLTTPNATTSVFFEDSRPQEANPALIAVCLPGIGDTRRQFRLLAPLLHEQLSCRVLLGDLRGFGDSTDFEDDATKAYSAYSPESVASDVTQLLDELHAKHPQAEFLLLGNSLSAGSMVLAATQAEGSITFKAVVLLGPILRDSSMDAWFRPLSHLLFRRLYGTGLWMSYYKTLYPAGKEPQDFTQELQLLETHIASKKGNIVNIGRFIRATKASVAAAVTQLGKRSSLPVLAFYGGKDPDYGNFHDELAWIKSAIPHVTCYEDLEGGHYPHVEDAQKVVDAIAKVLE